MSQHWSNVAERGSKLGIKFLVVCYNLAGKWLAMLLLFPIIFYFFATGKQARKSSQAFLNKAFNVNPSAFGNQAPGLWTTYRHFLTFGFSALDKVDSWLGKISPDQIVYENYAAFDELHTQQKGAIFIGSHLGNLEVCRAMSSHKYSVRMNVLVFTHHAKAFNEMLKGFNEDVELNLIQVTSLGPDIAIMLKERVDRGEFVIIVGDRTPVNNPGRVSQCDFMGETASFSQGPLILASLLECPVYLLFCMKEQSKYKVIFEPFATPKLELKRKERAAKLAAYGQQYADRLAHYAAKYPLQWFNFYDFWQHELASTQQENKAV